MPSGSALAAHLANVPGARCARTVACGVGPGAPRQVSWVTDPEGVPDDPLGGDCGGTAFSSASTRTVAGPRA